MGISHSTPTATIRCKSARGCTAELVIAGADRWATIAAELARHKWAVVKRGEKVPFVLWDAFCPDHTSEAAGPP